MLIKKETRSFYKRAITIAFPILIQNLITNVVALIDNVMVGRIGTEQMSGVAIVNQILFVFNIAIWGIVGGAGIFCAQYFGKEDYEGVRSATRFKLIAVTILTALGIAVFMIFGDNLIMSFLHEGEAGIDLNKTFMSAKQYMAIMLVGLVPFSLEQVYASTLREGGNSTPPMYAGIAAVIVNTALNWLLIFGVGPFPKLGVVGAAVATVISRFVMLAISAGWAHYRADTFVFPRGLYSTLKIPREPAKKYFTKSIVITFNETIWSLGFTMISQCYSVRGIDVVAGFNIANTVVNLFNVLYLAFGSGVAVVLGQLLGSNELDEARKAAPRLIGFGGLICVFVSAVMIMFARLFPTVYNTTEQVQGIATVLIIIGAVFMPIHSMLHCMFFTLRSGGKTLEAFMIDFIFSCVICVPLAYALVHLTKLNVFWVYLIIQSIEALKLAVGWILVKRGKWVSNIVD